MKFPLRSKNNSVYLSIGSNLGISLDNINKSIDLLNQNNKINFIKKSPIYVTEPLYYKNQNKFLNIVVEVTTKFQLYDFFEICKNIETKMGRKNNSEKNRSRIIDIDILTFNNDILNSDLLLIPHPLIHERKFVLVPWSEISANYVVPKYNLDVLTLLKNTKDSTKICKLTKHI